MRKTMLMTVAALAAAELFAIQGTVSTDVESVSGDVKWRGRDKKYVIEKGKITKEFKLVDVTSLNIPKPAGFDKAVQAVENGQGASAVATLTKIVAEDKSAGYSGDLASAYWQVLLKLGKREELEKMLKKAATSGDRQASAAALVMRGDIVVQGSNDAPEELKKALRDGYMRVVLMYQDPDCRRERGEAMLKAAACFDKLGQAARAENLRAQAKAI